MQSFKEFSDAYSTKITATISEVFDEYISGDVVQHRLVKDVVEKTKQYTLRGGKCIRGLLVLLGAQMQGKDINDDLLKAAACYEIVHASFLIHDDIMDDADTRRGFPSLHKDIETLKADQKFGTNNAIIAGDLLNYLAYTTLINIPMDIELRTKLRSAFDSILIDTCLGQILDYGTGFDDAAAADDALLVCSFKTSQYTIAGPLKLGAYLGGASEETIKTIEDLGKPLGIAFQLKDDLLDIFADSEKTGKPLFGDIAEGKKTFLMLKGLELASGEEKEKIYSALGKHDLSKEEGASVASILESSGAKSINEEEIAKCSAEAKEKAQMLPGDHTVLLDFIEFVSTRDR